jgi:hypothetical protein
VKYKAYALELDGRGRTRALESYHTSSPRLSEWSTVNVRAYALALDGRR